MIYFLLLVAHILGACIWVGGHIVLATRLLGAPSNLFTDSPPARVVQLKLALLAATVALAIHAKVRVIPRLRDDNLGTLAAHIAAVTTLAVLFTVAGASLPMGGYPLFSPSS